MLKEVKTGMKFVTTNIHKFEEVRTMLKEFGINIERVELKISEVRGTNEEIAMDAALKAYSIIKEPLIVEDSGLFINALNGFPGEFSKWVYNKIKPEGILKLMEGVKDRSAYFKAVVAYTDGKEIKTFTGIVEGSISYEEKGNKGFAFDVIFVPEGYSKTFAEMPEVKAKISHRVKAFKEFGKWFVKRQTYEF